MKDTEPTNTEAPAATENGFSQMSAEVPSFEQHMQEMNNQEQEDNHVEDYRTVDLESYVTDGIQNGRLHEIIAKKNAPISARRGEVGEQIDSWVEGPEGPVLERTGTVGVDEATGMADYVATKIDREGKVVLDKYGNKNEWIIKDSKFQYEEDPEHPGQFLPIAEPQTFVKVDENLTLIRARDGKEMKISAGGYINVKGQRAVSEKDFEDTYGILEEKSKESESDTQESEPVESKAEE